MTTNSECIERINALINDTLDEIRTEASLLCDFELLDWQEFILRYYADCGCKTENCCRMGVFDTLTVLDEFNVVAQGLSPSAAMTVYSNPAVIELRRIQRSKAEDSSFAGAVYPRGLFNDALRRAG